VILQEEGELTRAARLEAEGAAAQGAQVSLVLSHSEEAELAWFTGDWVALLRAAEEYLDVEDAETTEWDLQLRARRACLRLLCGEAPGGDLERCLEGARRSGFPRLMYSACAYAAFAQALDGNPDTAADLLAELHRVWERAPTACTVEWLSTMAHTCALAGSPAAAETAAALLASAPIRNRWVEAADAVVAGARAAASGDQADAARSYAIAVDRYDAIGGASDAVLAATWAARAYVEAGDREAAVPLLARVGAFAERNRAQMLRTLAG